MSTIHHTATSLISTCPDLTKRTTSQPSNRSRAVASLLRRTFDALYGGLAAYREFERLKSWGVPSNAALRQTFGQSTYGGNMEERSER